jgi:phosphoenolpyruvate carboxylase
MKSQEIESKRPLLAPDMPMSDIVKEILDTYKAGDIAGGLSAEATTVFSIWL